MAFNGGYIFKNFEGTAEPVLRECSVPETVFVPAEYSSLSFSPLVNKDDSVAAGQKILETHADIQHLAAKYLVSPVNGTVRDVNEKGVTIASDGTASFEPVEGHTREPWHLDQNSAISLFYSSGCACLLKDRFSSLQDFTAVRHIIINAVHNSPLNQSWLPELTGNTGLFLNGLKTLGVLFPEAEIFSACNKRNKNFFNSPEIMGHTSVRVMSDRYPQEHPILLSRDVVKRRHVSHDGIYDSSILVIPFFNVIQIAEAMTEGRPLIDRILLIAGPGVSRPGWYRVRIGTSFEEIKRKLLKSDEHGPWRIIRGNLFDGECITSLKSSILPTDSEISVIREYAVRDLWRFMNPGFTFDSYSKATVAEYIPLLPKQLDTNVHGGVRPAGNPYNTGHEPR